MKRESERKKLERRNEYRDRDVDEGQMTIDTDTRYKLLIRSRVKYPQAGKIICIS